jgi:hypothetical protein
MYPSSAEGFGFVPYEAASLGTPTVFTNFGPLREIAGLGDLPRTWSIDQHAADLVALLTDQGARDRRVAGLRGAIDHYTWALFAEKLVAFFTHITSMPEVATAAVGADGSSAEAALVAISNSRSYKIAQRLQKLKPGRS